MMTINDWKKRHRLSYQEVGDILGISPGACSNKRDNEATGSTAAFLRAVDTMPEITFGSEAGSYGQPVAYFDGGKLAYGPADVIRGDGRIAAHVVVVWACMPERSEDEYQTAKRFLRYWPDGPHLR